MKKIVFGLLMIILMVMNVRAAGERKLYFIEQNNKIQYDSKLLDENTFMKHEDMTPGEEFTDELLIENGTNNKYSLYLKARETEESNELLDNIRMRVEVDDKIVYDGYARGIDYSVKGDNEDLTKDVNLQNTIYIGTYDAKSDGKVVVTTRLDPNYDNPDQVKTVIDWDFYADYTMMVPETSDDSWKYVVAFVSALALIIFGFFLYKKVLKHK